MMMIMMLRLALLTISSRCEGRPHYESSFSIQICCPLSRLRLQDSVPSMKWHYPSTLFSVFLFSFFSGKVLWIMPYPEICLRLAWCDRNISTSCFSHLLVNVGWHLAACLLCRTRSAQSRFNNAFISNASDLCSSVLCMVRSSHSWWRWRGLKNSCASGFRPSLKTCIPKIFIGPSKILVQFLVCFRRFTENKTVCV